MHYYQHHIGDFIKDTANLNDHQLATYMRMLWSYYSDEKPIAADVEDIAFAMRSDEKTVRLLLKHYFTESSEGWRHSRCDKEISRYHQKSEKAKSSAKSRWKNADDMRTHKDLDANASIVDANQEPRTNNQEPIKNKQKKETAKTKNQTAKPPDVSDAVWSDFLLVRKARKLPLTETALRLLRSGAEKGGYGFQEALEICCARGWASFDPNWLKTPSKPVHSELPTETAYQRSMRLRYEEASGLRSAIDRNVIDITPMQTHAARIA